MLYDSWICLTNEPGQRNVQIHLLYNTLLHILYICRPFLLLFSYHLHLFRSASIISFIICLFHHLFLFFPFYPSATTSSNFSGDGEEVSVFQMANPPCIPCRLPWPEVTSRGNTNQRCMWSWWKGRVEVQDPPWGHSYISRREKCQDRHILALVIVITGSSLGY